MTGQDLARSIDVNSPTGIDLRLGGFIDLARISSATRSGSCPPTSLLQHARYQPAMAANALHDYIRPLDDLATEMPNVISSWDSHETSLMPADAPKLRQALPSVANEPYRHRRGRAGVKMLNRR